MVVVFGNATASPTPVWKPEPGYRGTWGILSTCIITISLCVWTAVHLNLPEHTKTQRKLWTKSKWLVLGLAAPEIVAYVAWHQRREAGKLLRDVRLHLGQDTSQPIFRRFKAWLYGILRLRYGPGSSPSSPRRSQPSKQSYRSQWTLVHGFYAAMGGFALDSSASDELFLPKSRLRAALTPEGIRFLLKHEPGFLPDISEDQIKDKSKADGLKKFLVCTQALWFCIQCMSRLAKALPISLLELNTFGHALCTLLIYMLWWHKPLDVEEPTLIQEENLSPLFAYLWMSSKISAKGHRGYDISGSIRDEFDCIWPYRDPVIDDLSFFSSGLTAPPNIFDSQTQSNTVENHDPAPPTDCSPTRIHSPSDHFATYEYTLRRYPATSKRYHFKLWFLSQGFLIPAGLSTRNTTIEHLSPVDVARWRLAYRAIAQYHLEEELHTRHQTDAMALIPRVKPRIQNFPSPLDGERDQHSPLELWLGFAVSSALYGGLHLLGWNAPFGTRLEAIMWRVSASSVTLTGLLLGPLVLYCRTPAARRGFEGIATLATLKRPQQQLSRPSILLWLEIVVTAIVYLCFMALLPALGLTYLSARAYLVIECFKNVAHLPQGAFELPDWSNYFPHIL